MSRELAALCQVHLEMSGFLVPFAFVFQPALLLQGTTLEIIMATVMTGLGVACLAAALFLWTRVRMPQVKPS